VTGRSRNRIGLQPRGLGVADSTAGSRGNAGGAGPSGGFVTAETAVVLPVLAVVLVACLAGTGVVREELQIQDAARLAARQAARGEPDASVADIARRYGPPGVSTRIRHDGDFVHVRLEAPASLPGVFGRWTDRLPLSAEAVALDEASATAGAP
jgi:hypothetical protein